MATKSCATDVLQPEHLDLFYSYVSAGSQTLKQSLNNVIVGAQKGKNIKLRGVARLYGAFTVHLKLL